MAIQNFKHFSVWQKSFDLVLLVYKYTRNFPAEERFCLISDIRRAANSVMHNIAEGYGRYEKKDKTRFYKISRGSAYEILSQLEICGGLKYIGYEDITNLKREYESIIHELNKLIKTIESRINS